MSNTMRVSIFLRDLGDRAGDGPGVAQMLVHAAMDLEDAEDVVDQMWVWAWWSEALVLYHQNRSRATAEAVLRGEIGPE